MATRLDDAPAASATNESNCVVVSSHELNVLTDRAETLHRSTTVTVGRRRVFELLLQERDIVQAQDGARDDFEYQFNRDEIRRSLIKKFGDNTERLKTRLSPPPGQFNIGEMFDRVWRDDFMATLTTARQGNSPVPRRVGSHR